jgi:hypothetical protein
MLVTVVQWADSTGSVTRFLDHSKLIRLGKTIGFKITHWESAEKQQWI